MLILVSPSTTHYENVVPPPLTVEEKILAELPPVFIEIAKAESSMRPTAYNPEGHKGCSGSYGLFQIACVHVDDPNTLYDVDTNIQIAKRLYEDQGFQPWSVCTKKIVKCYE